LKAVGWACGICTINAWPMQHPVLAAAAWSAFILAVAGPFAAWLFRRRTTE
jgi:ABC-2 type transport system permease protein